MELFDFFFTLFKIIAGFIAVALGFGLSIIIISLAGSIGSLVYDLIEDLGGRYENHRAKR